MKRRMNNTELVAHLMDFARTGPLMQAVVITALENYCQAVVKQPPGFLGEATALINEDAWKRCAQEVLDTLANRDQFTVEEAEDEED